MLCDNIRINKDSHVFVPLEQDTFDKMKFLEGLK